MEIVVAGNDGRNRHGYPRGYHFVPKGFELIRLLEDKIAGHQLPYPLTNIFHDVRILDFHPDDLYDAYKAHEEAGCLYFFSRREYPRKSDRGRPMRGTKDGGNWKASGGGKLVSNTKRGGVNVGYELTMVFYDRRKPGDDKKNSGMTEWGMHEYTKIVGHGPTKKKGIATSYKKRGDRCQTMKVEDLALYCLYKKKTKQAGQHVAASSDGSSKLEQLSSSCPMAGGTASMASTSQAHAVDHFKLADWNNKLTLPSPLAQSTASGTHDLPTWTQQQDAEYPGLPDSNEQQLLKMLQPPPLPASVDEGYQADEFDVWCKMQQEQQAASPCWLFPMPGDDDDLPMLTDEENHLYTCTMDELFAGMPDEPEMSIEEPDYQPSQVKSSKSNQ